MVECTGGAELVDKIVPKAWACAVSGGLHRLAFPKRLRNLSFQELRYQQPPHEHQPRAGSVLQRWTKMDKNRENRFYAKAREIIIAARSR